MTENEYGRCLEILDRPDIASKQQFLIACAAAGIDADDRTYDDTLAYEISQLRNIRKISDMFSDNAEASLFEYKKHFRLVLSVGTESNSDDEIFSVKAVGGGDFSFSMKMMRDLRQLHGLDPDAEAWNLLRHDVLKR